MTDERDYSHEDPLDEPADEAEGLRDRISSRSPDAVADAVNVLLDNPVINQALKAAFGARDLATGASSQTMHALNVATASELERVTRRLRSLSDRLEEVEDRIDELSREVAKARGETRADSAAASTDPSRLGLSE